MGLLLDIYLYLSAFLLCCGFWGETHGIGSRYCHLLMEVEFRCRLESPNGSHVLWQLVVKHMISYKYVYKERVVAIGGFSFHLSLLVLLYSKARYDFETVWLLSCPALLISILSASWAVSDTTFRVTNITYARPCPLQVPKLWFSTAVFAADFSYE